MIHFPTLLCAILQSARHVVITIDGPGATVCDEADKKLRKFENRKSDFHKLQRATYNSQVYFKKFKWILARLLYQGPSYEVGVGLWLYGFTIYLVLKANVSSHILYQRHKTKLLNTHCAGCEQFQEGSTV